MIIRIDWISFSVAVEPTGSDDERKAARVAAEAIRALSADAADWLMLADGDWQPRAGRAPYKMAFHCEEVGATVYVHPRLTHALCEVSGRGCERLYNMGLDTALVAAVQSRVTRVDIACDMITDVRPSEFVGDDISGRFKSVSHVTSPSGETVYVGSRSSERYARVYRYNPPHERHHLLRCEFVVKAENAKIVASTIQEKGLESVVSALANSFRWKHPCWRLDSDPAELRAYRPDRKEGKTLFWLADTIAPLLRRLHEEGTIDAYEWFETHVIRK